MRLLLCVRCYAFVFMRLFRHSALSLVNTKVTHSEPMSGDFGDYGERYV